MNQLSAILSLHEEEKQSRGLLHTPREIWQQPDSWATTYRKILERQPEIEEFLELSGVGSHSGADLTVFLIGAGTSDYIGHALAHLLRKHWRCEVLAVSSTDLLTNVDDWLLPDKPYLWISFSRSGESSEGVALLELALDRYPWIPHLIVSCNRDGRMVRQFSPHSNVYSIVLDDSVNDRGLAMTSSFTNMVVAGQCLAHFKQLSNYEQFLEPLVAMGKNLLEPAAHLAVESSKESYELICFVGTGALKAVARESALKVLELTAGRILTMSESFLGIRHGPLSALNSGTLVVCFLSGDERRRKYETDLIAEMSSKGIMKKLIAILPGNEIKLPKSSSSISLGAPDHFADDYRPPLDAIFGQLLGLFSSLHYELKPDTPSPNGAISRVVSQVNIY